MSVRKHRVLVVDDSAVVRELICDVLRGSDQFEVASVASNGRQALEIFAVIRPDIVTLDIQMPVMDGLETLRQLLVRRPVPVVMVSSLTQFGAEVTLEALECGAFDYVSKPDGCPGQPKEWQADLLRKLKMATTADMRRLLAMRAARTQRRRQPPNDPIKTQPAGDLADKVIVLGTSTGGPPALTCLFERFTGPLPPLVIVQHMPAGFTNKFAARLNSAGILRCKEAATNDLLEPNCAYIAPGGIHLEVVPHGNRGRLIVREGDPVSGHRPSIDVTMTSAAAAYGDRCLGIIMTGMGRDGSDGCRAIKQAGGYVLGQDERTSDVYGMNRAAFIEGNVDKQFGLDQGAMIIEQTVRKLWSEAGAEKQRALHHPHAEA